ncbi:MAG: mechanosensitive ion channel family protein [Burkholderiaceae bacterium]|nr:mechanosensitive ion channel family protein [Burkholderiaceae bacterium]
MSLPELLLSFPETYRIALTAAVLGLGWFATRLVARVLARSGAGDSRSRREQRVWSRNFILALTLFAVLGIWGSKLAGFAFALTAVAAAALIVSKDFLANLLGTATLVATRPYRLDDYIEVAGVRGQVVGTSLLSTTLAETFDSNQLTGKTVTIPNAVLLTHPVRNETATGAFIVQIVRVAADTDSDLEQLEQFLLASASEVCEPWFDEAAAHLARIEARNLVDLPSAAPRVLLSLDDPKHARLALRYVCRTNDRVRVEQMILRRYRKKLREAKAAIAAASHDESATALQRKIERSGIAAQTT